VTLATTGRRRSDRERGSALLVALLIVCAMSAIGLGTLTIVGVDRLSTANEIPAEVAMGAADAAVEHVIADLSAIPDWASVPGGSQTSVLFDVSAAPMTSWGLTVDLAGLTAALQREEDARPPQGDSTRWRLFLAGTPDVLDRTAGAPPFLVAWVGDDCDETDGDPAVDVNGVLRVHALALAPAGIRAEREVVVGRAVDTGAVRLVSWRDAP
jgi:hypothetical protein